MSSTHAPIAFLLPNKTMPQTKLPVLANGPSILEPWLPAPCTLRWHWSNHWKVQQKQQGTYGYRQGNDWNIHNAKFTWELINTLASGKRPRPPNDESLCDYGSYVVHLWNSFGGPRSPEGNFWSNMWRELRNAQSVHSFVASTNRPSRRFLSTHNMFLDFVYPKNGGLINIRSVPKFPCGKHHMFSGFPPMVLCSWDL